jgi:subtilase family serine protease
MQKKKAYSLMSALALFFGLLFHGAGGVAQQAPNRITQEIVSGSMVPVRGSANPHAAAPYDTGHVDPSTRLTGVTMHFKLTPEQKQELDTLVAAQQTPGSAYYHKWITPEEYASRFGLSNHDLEVIQAWLEQQGLSIDQVAKSRNSISFSGTAAQIESAFHTEIHN